MVRLGAGCRNNHIQIYFISIPVWCDWEFIVFSPLKKVQNFNSSMVRLGVGDTYAVFGISLHFNSSMVRLGAAKGTDGTTTYTISIPVWCDWEHQTPT